MQLPELVINPRDREFRKYSRELREEVVVTYLFKDVSSRRLDEIVLNLDSKKSRGYQSWAILRHYGLGDDFKGIFKGMTKKQALDLFPDDGRYNQIYDIIDETLDEGEENLDTPSWVLGFNKARLVNTRVHQSEFREKVLGAYNRSCCITGIREPKLLRASHIKPWCMSNEKEKTDVHNGLCLNTLHDAAFDAGLITVDPSTYCIKLSSSIEEKMDQSVYDDYFRRYDGKSINLPSPNDVPEKAYLEFHRNNIFEKKKQYEKLELELIE